MKKPYLISELNSIIDFGKYNGKTVKTVYTTDASYLLWIINNTDKTNFPQHLKDQIELKADEEDNEYDDISWGDYHDIF